MPRMPTRTPATLMAALGFPKHVDRLHQQLLGHSGRELVSVAAALLQTGIAFPGDGAPAGLLSGTEMALQASDGTALDWADLPAGSCSLQGSISYIAGS